MTMAWKSYRDGEVAVGAAITDAWAPYSAVAVTSASPRWHRGGCWPMPRWKHSPPYRTTSTALAMIDPNAPWSVSQGRSLR